MGGGPLTSPDNGLDPSTYKDIVVARYASNGTHIWSRRIGSEADVDRGYAIATAPNGDVVVTGVVGAYTDFGNETLSPIFGAGDAFVARYAAADGALRWYHLMGSTNTADAGTAITVDSADNTIVAGNFAGVGNFDGGDPNIPSPGNITSAGGSRDVFVAKYASNGAYRWAKRYGGTNDDSVNGIGADSAGNVRITGKYVNSTSFAKASGSIDLTSPGTYRTYLAELDGNGAAIWAKAYGGSLAIDSGALAVAADGRATVVGTFQGSNIDFDGANATAAGGKDAFVVRVAPDGTRTWLKTFGTTSDETATGVSVDAAGNAIVTGSFAGSVNFGGGAVSATATDVYLVSYGVSVGAFRWAHRYGAGFNQYGVTTAALADGRVALGGHFLSSLDLGSGAMVSAGNYDGAFGTVVP
jgi:hypothetical protein